MICLDLAGKQFEISKSKNLLYVLTGCEFSILIMTFINFFNDSKQREHENYGLAFENACQHGGPSVLQTSFLTVFILKFKLYSGFPTFL